MPSETESVGTDYEDCEIKLNSQVFTKLTEVVREQYLKFLEKQLEVNMRTWQEDNDIQRQEQGKSYETSIHECAKTLEDLALKEATITQLYQRAMIKTIAVVKRNTKEKMLMEQLVHFLKLNDKSNVTSASTQTALKITYETKAIQTENYEYESALTLDQRIDLFQTQLKKGHINGERLENSIVQKSNAHVENSSSKRRRLSRRSRHDRSRPPTITISPAAKIWHSPTPPVMSLISKKNITIQSEDDFGDQLEGDEIAQELEKIFTEQETNLHEIFGLVSHRTDRDCDTTMEVKCHATPSSHIPQSGSETPCQKQKENLNKIDKPNEPILEVSNANEQQQIFPIPIKDLRYSLWPCERFMQKRRLSETLNRLVEEDIRWHDILKWQFSVLFGDEENDDFAPCSPSIEMDEILRSSCMRRISPWVVRHLMKPLNEGLIGNRFLFKKFAKKLAYYIIMENQYPDECVIKNTIENYFCMHRPVMSSEDLDDIEMIVVGDCD